MKAPTWHRSITNIINRNKKNELCSLWVDIWGPKAPILSACSWWLANRRSARSSARERAIGFMAGCAGANLQAEGSSRCLREEPPLQAWEFSCASKPYSMALAGLHGISARGAPRSSRENRPASGARLVEIRIDTFREILIKINKYVFFLSDSIPNISIIIYKKLRSSYYIELLIRRY